MSDSLSTLYSDAVCLIRVSGLPLDPRRIPDVQPQGVRQRRADNQDQAADRRRCRPCHAVPLLHPRSHPRQRCARRSP